ncbi:CPBP family intramembrane glutamic endopeptidase [Natronobeatus ordinarius]|uniref:CPBP family intramembrane glutamic endopeptidase n=1 Tax=Natronobeatus ordinarius TaxID=2963433 RepID=UPI0020CE400F|nr:type II CAAX endopeptidase family protein [Natronobeatus ordinarius]
MPQWGTFAGLTGVVLALLLALSYLTQTAFDADRSTVEHADESPGHDGVGSPLEDGTDAPLHPGCGPVEDRADSSDREPAVDPSSELETPVEPTGGDERERAPAEPGPPESLSTGELLANVAISQGLFAGLLLGAIVYTGIPAAALGIAFTREYLVAGLVVGTVLGLVLYVANELGSASAKRLGFDPDETLRELLAPESAGGWLVLLLVVLPIIAVFEELLFRAALIGALSVGFDLSPWLLAVGSSIAFGVGHGMQGRVGIVVTGTLGFALAAAFILTESLLVVIVAHYLINALEFVVHEGLGLEWTETLRSDSGR